MTGSIKTERIHPLNKHHNMDVKDLIANNSCVSLLKKCRKAKGYTLEELSELTGLSSSYISRLEAGERRYNSDLLTKLSSVLGCSEYELLKNKEDASIEKEVTYLPQKDLPVYKAIPAEAVPGAAGKFPIVNFEEIDKKIFRLPQLMGIKSAFAFNVVDSKNAPKYRIGDLVFVNTEKLMTKECAVVVLTKAYEIILGCLDSWTTDEVKVSYFGTKEEHTFARKNLCGFYSVLGSFDNFSQRTEG